jgi:hypothetical protein
MVVVSVIKQAHKRLLTEKKTGTLNLFVPPAYYRTVAYCKMELEIFANLLLPIVKQRRFPLGFIDCI